MWHVMQEVEESLDKWGNQSLKEINCAALESLLLEVTTVFTQLQNKYGTASATQRLEQLKNLVANLTPIIKSLCNENLEDRHWQKLEHKLNCSFQYDLSEIEMGILNRNEKLHSSSLVVRYSNISLSYLLKLDVLKDAQVIHDIVDEAAAEAAITRTFTDTIKFWECQEIPFMSCTDSDSKETVILGDTTECLASLEESEVCMNLKSFNKMLKINSFYRFYCKQYLARHIPDQFKILVTNGR